MNASLKDEEEVKGLNSFYNFQQEMRQYDQQIVKRTFCGGAGAILYSSLVYEGWHLPPFLLVDTDERMLFDLEVKIKLSHSSVESLLTNAIVDFPPNAIMQRPGLLQAMLDILGSQGNGNVDYRVTIAYMI